MWSLIMFVPMDKLKKDMCDVITFSYLVHFLGQLVSDEGVPQLPVLLLLIAH